MKAFKYLVTIALLMTFGFLSSFTQNAEADDFSMRLTTDTPDVMPQGMAAVWFGEEVEKRLPGAEVKIFNASSLYNNADSLEAMHAGTLEACWATLSKISGIIKQGLCLRTPTLFSSYEQVQKIPETGIGEAIAAAAEDKGFIVLGWGNVSPYIGVGARERILITDDWKGKKVRIYEKDTQMVMVKMLGGNPIVMPWGEFVPSVQSGVVDAGFTSLGSWGPVKETLPYFTSIGLIPDYYVFMVAKRWWDKLPSETREVVAAVAKEAGRKQMAMQFEKDQADLRKFKAADPSQPGFHLLAGEQLEVYKKIWLKPVGEVIEKKIGKDGKPLLELAEKLSKEL